MIIPAHLGRRRSRLAIALLALALAASASIAPGLRADAATATRTVSGVIGDATTGAVPANTSITLEYGESGTVFAYGSVSKTGKYSFALPKVAGTGFYVAVFTDDGKHVLETHSPSFDLTTTTPSFTRNVKIAAGARLTGHATPTSTTARYAQAYTADGDYSGYPGSVESNGAFTITGLAAGTYRVRISGDDIAPVYVGGTSSLAAATAFEVATGQTIDTGVTAVSPGATISGHVTGSPGGAADMAEVSLLDVDAPSSEKASFSPSHPPFGAFTYTDENGYYSLENVPAGTYTLRFGASYNDVKHVTQFSAGNNAGVVHRSDAEQIAVSGTGQITRDIALPLGGSITGTVTADGKRATFTSTAYAQDSDGKWEALARGSSYEGDGKYVIPGLSAGTYKVGFTSYSTAALFTDEYYDDSRTIADSQTVQVVGTSATKGINAVLTVAGPLAKFATHPLPVITGTTAVRSKLTAVPGTWSPTATSYTYQWKRNGTAISGATKSTYTLLGADAGKAITVTVKGVRSGYTSISQTSAATDAVTPGTITISSVTTGGTHAVGATQKAVTIVSPSSATLTYQWLRDGATISGATKATHKLVAADGGKAVSVRVTAKITGYTTTSQSSASFTPPRALTATPVPKITGTAAVGKKLTAKAGTWSPAPVTLTYQWKRGSTSIAKATKSTYTPTATDRGKKLTVVVSGAKSGYSKVAKSSASVTVK
ncbi:carboxypeptidase family protein [Frondihabitans sp. PhB188]|uniref:carboxypeptidase regulatory-like domain-containing protein n=1 Tax=Frondihabitans sp. PhB188 TaxID=2485200 RepID=UPI000F486C87|nr:carboxypeptidase regulatory-like domain-containing protein [Frondihabitans sp. PhB188]ROQ40699.1 carboxypeptidase family protein [Frondihabitans sp. PhB188]